MTATEQQCGRSRHLPDLVDALADLGRAARAGVPAAAVEYQRAVVLLGVNDRAGAVASLRACLEHEPGHRQARELLDRLTSRR